MNQTTYSLGLLIAIVVTSTLSLNATQTEKMTTKNIKYPAANYADDNFDPGSEWQLVWADEFDAEEINSDNWNFQKEPAGRFNGEWQRYTTSSENAYIDQGNLVIKAIHESNKHGMDQYTSARLNTAGKQTFKHGRVAARVQLPFGEGMWPAFWMLGHNIDENGGDTPWPETGEIDIMEFYGSKDDAAIEANIHFAGKDGKHAQMGAKEVTLDQGIFADNFHVFEIEWDHERIIWYLDGKEYARHPLSAKEYTEFHQPYFILLNIAVGGKWAGRPNNTTQFPQYMYVDWVRVYQKS